MMLVHEPSRRSRVKGADMALIPFPDYIRRAEDLLLRGASPLYVRRQVFVSTEDPLVIQQAGNGPGAMLGSWAAVYYDLPRVNDGAIKQIAAIRGTMSAGRLARLHLLQVRFTKTEQQGRFWFDAGWRLPPLQLLMALECDAWVGTRASNWNRLIDELR